MKGYLYKEWKLNRVFFLLTAAIAIGIVFLPLIIVMVRERTISREAFLYFAKYGLQIKEIFIYLGVWALLCLQEWSFLRDDDMKAWGLFVASNPKGIRGYICTKYGFAAAMCFCFFILSAGFDYIFTLIFNTIGRMGMPRSTEVFWMLFLVLLLLNAMEMPFVIRFGLKRGNTIKLILGIALFLICTGVFMENPFGIIDKIFLIFADKKIPFSVKWGLPIISIVSYILSCLLSCKLYLKGVFQYYR